MRSSNVSMRTRLLKALSLITLLAVANMAQAKDYIIEVVIFENLQKKDSVISGSLYYPKLSSSMSLKGERAQSAGFSEIEDGLTLTESAEKIRSSGRYRLLKHFAWRQPGLERKEAKAIRVNLGRATSLYLPEDLKGYNKFIPASDLPQEDRTRKINTTTLNGTIKVSLGRFLHMDAHMVFTDMERGVSFGMAQSRKMRSKELHYIDNQRFGILTRILPVADAGS